MKHSGWPSLLVVCVAAACSTEDSSQRLVLQPGLLAALDVQDEVDVIVSFADPAPSRLFADPAGHRAAIGAVREALLAAGRAGFVPTRQFDHIPAVAGRLSRAALDALSRHPAVSFIQVDSPGHGALTVSVPAVGGDVAKREYQVTGKGIRVAVLDTGINSTHPDLKSSVVATQHCFTRGACPPGNSSEGTSAEDDHGHGSHVSGIVTSDGVVAGQGFAPDAEIVAVKINDRNSSGFAADWAAGLDWLFTNLSTLKVRVVNASISTNQLYSSASDCDRGEPALARAVSNLVSAGVTIFASAGNRGSSTQVSAPACNTGVIAVGATYKSSQGRQPTSGTYASRWGNQFADCADNATAFDQVACFSNSGSRVDMVAPGAVIVSDVLQGRTEAYRGTSQASPTAAGVAALMLECNPQLTPTRIKDILVRTGVAVTDPKNGASFPSIRAAAAVKEACGLPTDAGAGDAKTGDAASVGDLRDAERDQAGADGMTGPDGRLGSDGLGGGGGAGAGGLSSSGGNAGSGAAGGLAGWSGRAGALGAGGFASGGTPGSARSGGAAGSGGLGSGGRVAGAAGGGRTIAASGGGPGNAGGSSSGGSAEGGSGGLGSGGAGQGGSGGATERSTESSGETSGCSCTIERSSRGRGVGLALLLGWLAVAALRRKPSGGRSGQ